MTEVSSLPKGDNPTVPVRPFVHGELSGCWEALGTLWALVRAFAGVRAKVLHQWTHLGEGLFAMGARVGALDMVSFQVVQTEACNLLERLLAHGALCGTSLGMDLLVAGQLNGVAEATAALCAAQRVVPPVTTLVLSQVVQCPKDFLALGTLVPALGRLAGLTVRPHMSLEVGQEKEFLSTLSTD